MCDRQKRHHYRGRGHPPRDFCPRVCDPCPKPLPPPCPTTVVRSGEFVGQTVTVSGTSLIANLTAFNGTVGPTNVTPALTSNGTSIILPVVGRYKTDYSVTVAAQIDIPIGTEALDILLIPPPTAFSYLILNGAIQTQSIAAINWSPATIVLPTLTTEGTITWVGTATHEDIINVLTANSLLQLAVQGTGPINYTTTFFVPTTDETGTPPATFYPFTITVEGPLSTSQAITCPTVVCDPFAGGAR